MAFLFDENNKKKFRTQQFQITRPTRVSLACNFHHQTSLIYDVREVKDRPDTSRNRYKHRNEDDQTALHRTLKRRIQ